METIILLIAAIAPAALLFGYIRWADRHQPEPLSLLLNGLRYGAAAGIVAGVMEMVVSAMLSSFLSIPVIGSVLRSFVVAGCCEEAVKLGAFYLLVRRNKYFDEYFDGVVYCVSVGLGFAALENVAYLFGAGDAWISTALVRAALSVPGHYAFAVIMGSLYALVHFDPERYGRLKPWVFLAPVVAHGIYDTFCFWETEASAEYPFVSLVLFVVLIVFCVYMHKWAKRRFDFLLYVDKTQKIINEQEEQKEQVNKENKEVQKAAE